jgi:hypothetical protein
MRAILSIAALVLAGCADPRAAADRWNDYQTDLAVVKAFHKYTCGACMARHHSLEGYSKENVSQVSVSKNNTPRLAPRPSPAPQATEQVNRQVYDLNQRIAVLEEALKTNATTTNANEQLIVSQIVSLKSQLAQLQTSAPMAVVTPAPRQETTSGIRIPGN